MMGTKYKLSWRANEGRWRKRYKGKDYYFAAPEGKVASYQRCLNEWKKKQAELDSAAHFDDPDKMAWRLVMDQLVSKMEAIEASAKDGDMKARVEWLICRDDLAKVQMAAGRNEPYFFSKEQAAETDFEDPSQVPIWIPEPTEEPTRRPPWDQIERIPGAEPDKSIEGNVKRFLDAKKREAERGDISLGRYDALRVGLEAFVSFAGPTKPIEAINSHLLSRFRDHLQTRVDKDEMKASYAATRLTVTKQFVRWAWEHEIIGLPRIVESRGFSISVPQRKIELFSVDEIKRLLDSAPEAHKLHLLLMLNTGMQQQDIADLRHDEVDWEAGRLTRKRSKTKKHENVPAVEYLLWEETFRLLKKHRSNHPELALTNRKGEPLKYQWIIEGKLKKKDNLHSAYVRLIRKIKEDEEAPLEIKKPMRLLRKTSASKLAEHESFGRFAQHFLGHSPGTVADKFYVKPSQTQFDEALRWLEAQFKQPTP